MARKEKKPFHLVLGWVVNDQWQPIYWEAPDARSGFQKDTDLILSDTQEAAYHTIIVAQSGSGKSYFLGRLLEEILLRTKCRLLVFDPNSDFRKFSEMESGKWGLPKEKSKGAYPHEKSRRPFSQKWKGLSKKVCVYAGARAAAAGMGLTPIQLDWLDFSIDWFTDDTDPAFQSEMRHCHAFVRDYFGLCVDTKTFDWRDKQAKSRTMLEDIRNFFRETEGWEKPEVLQKLKERFGAGSEGTTCGREECDANLRPAEAYDDWLAGRLTRAAQRRVNVSPLTARAYFSIAEEEAHSDIFAEISPPKKPKRARVHVVDLPSIRDRAHRLMAVSRFLDEEMDRARTEWESAMAFPKRDDTRVPTFVVVEEAHHLVGNQPDSRAARRLRDQFRSVAAEGRKFGVFLVLVTQRPDKLDPIAISECENRAIMKLNSEAVVETTAQLLGLNKSATDILKDAQPLKLGRALLCGPWAKTDKSETVRMYGAMRRTVEGGKNLDKEYWARPYDGADEGTD